MTHVTFPAGFGSLDLDIQWARQQARDEGGSAWETEDGDPFWAGKISTGELNHDKLQDWHGFYLDAVARRGTIEFIDPVYFIPRAYRSIGLPGGFGGTGAIVNVTDPAAPVFSGLPVGLVLKRGDPLNLSDGTSLTYHRLRSDVTVASNTAQALNIVPYALDNVFGPGDSIVLINPKILLNITPNSWSAPRRPRQLTVGSFEVLEAPLGS